MTGVSRNGSGTSWLPDNSPMFARHATYGMWSLMFHENVFVQYLDDAGRRGRDQFGSINWVMGMAQRNLGRGQLGVHGMFSAEPWSIRGCGYPDLLATGERCAGEQIRDQQHPHDLLMELALEYNAPLAGNARWQLYGAPAGEPALGPVAYPHRVSAMANPLAPISHHWMDSTHITFGVVTAAVYGQRWKAEVSAFNGREPDENRTDVDIGALDSISGRASWLPTANLALQISAGRLNDAERGDTDVAIDVTRVTASVSYHLRPAPGRLWATTVGWGRNGEAQHASDALLIESSLSLANRNLVYGRFEIAEKRAHDLDVTEPPESFVVSKLQGGYTRYLPPVKGFQAGIGAGASLAIVPESLKSAYGSRTNAGGAVYFTFRPAAIGDN